MQAQLLGGERGGVGAAEQLQQSRIAQLVDVRARVRAPQLELAASARAQPEHPPPTAVLLLLLLQQASLRQARALGVQLRVGDAPEVEDALLRDLLELVRRRGAALLEQSEHGVGGLAQPRG